MIPNPSNDGDSFHVRANGKEYIFRIYFADAPETDNDIAARVKEQAKYFGLNIQETLEVGREAKSFTRRELAGEFRARTCFEDAMGRSRLERFYAFILTKDGDLAELLVQNGLARVHGASAAPEGQSNSRPEWQKLESLERTAKYQKLGGWGVTSGRLAVRAEIKEKPNELDAFDRFFHPEKAANQGATPSPTTAPVVASPLAMPSPTPTAVAASNKLDVNTATEAQLEEIPGVGETIANRIMQARPFKSADDLRQVKGIGDGRYAKLRPYFN